MILNENAFKKAETEYTKVLGLQKINNSSFKLSGVTKEALECAILKYILYTGDTIGVD